MSFAGRPKSPPWALVSSSQICIAMSAGLPLPASLPVSDMPRPTLIGSAACAEDVASATRNAAPNHRAVLPIPCSVGSRKVITPQYLALAYEQNPSAQLRMPTAREATIAMVHIEIAASAIISSLALAVSGKVSDGEKAVALVKARNR